MIKYAFRWIEPEIDPRTVMAVVAEPVNRRSSEQKWEIFTAEAEPNQAVIDELNATGLVLGNVVASVVLDG